MDELQSYSAVIDSLLKKKRTPHLLLGNGFSMSYDKDIFSYNALHNFIEKIEDEFLSKLFEIVKTKNFELVMQQLDNFCELIEVFGSDDKLLNKVTTASENLKRSLIDAVNEMHPEHVFTVPEEERQQCASFLSAYVENKGNIFSTNYDLLLYWVLMSSELKNCIDGFGRDREDDEDDPKTEPDYSELRWGRNKSNQNIHHLHGTLSIFDTGIDVMKEEYDGSYLLENIQARLSEAEYPVFVASGNGEEKLNHIMHNQYLSFCYETLSNIEGSLVTFGFNFGEYDHHIIDAINAATKHKKDKEFGDKLWSIYIGVYSEDDKKHIESIQGMFKCKVQLFDARTVNVWRDT
jgi:hypothetical protein